MMHRVYSSYFLTSGSTPQRSLTTGGLGSLSITIQQSKESDSILFKKFGRTLIFLLNKNSHMFSPKRPHIVCFFQEGSGRQQKHQDLYLLALSPQVKNLLRWKITSHLGKERKLSFQDSGLPHHLGDVHHPLQRLWRQSWCCRQSCSHASSSTGRGKSWLERWSSSSSSLSPTSLFPSSLFSSSLSPSSLSSSPHPYPFILILILNPANVVPTHPPPPDEVV